MGLPRHGSKDVLLTGASGAIGTAIARRLAKAGFRLHLTSRDSKKLTGLQKEFSKSPPVLYTLDLQNLDEARGVVDQFFKNAEHPFALICNAGDLGVLGRFLDTDFNTWHESLNQNFLAHAAMIHAFGLRFVSGNIDEGSVVVLSGAGLGGPVTPNLSSYGTSKAALTYLVEALAAEWSPHHLTINSVAPGQVKSGITEQALRAGADRVGVYAESARKCMESGGVSPDLAAQLIEFLLSPAARGVSGRLLSARFDQKRLREDTEAVAQNKHLYRLRRIDEDLFGSCKAELKS